MAVVKTDKANVLGEMPAFLQFSSVNGCAYMRDSLYAARYFGWTGATKPTCEAMSRLRSKYGVFSAVTDLLSEVAKQTRVCVREIENPKRAVMPETGFGGRGRRIFVTTVRAVLGMISSSTAAAVPLPRWGRLGRNGAK